MKHELPRIKYELPRIIRGNPVCLKCKQIKFGDISEKGAKRQ